MAKEVAKSSPLSQLEETLDLYFGKKAPALPSNIKEVIVNFAPWITVIFVVLLLQSILTILGTGVLIGTFNFLGGASSGYSLILTLISSVLGILFRTLSLPGLFKKSRQGWNFVFYSTLVGILSNLLHFNLTSLVIGGLISFYFLFQVRSYYK